MVSPLHLLPHTRAEIFYGQTELTKEACIVIDGNFGGIWDGRPVPISELVPES